MSPAEGIAGLLVVTVVLYGVLAGADFGGGVLDLLARGPRKNAQREAIAHALGPVWEANHVWLIFAIVLLFSSFPRAYEALSVGLFVPFHLVLVGITLRGAAFVFRAYGPPYGSGHARWGRVFGVASMVTPVLLGQCLGAISSGAMRVAEDGTVSTNGAWWSPLALAMGLFALALCTYVAAVFLTVETEGELREDFRRRALEVGTAVVALSVILLPLVRLEAWHLWASLASARAAPLLTLGAVAALASGGLLRARQYRRARVAAVLQVGCVLSGWGAAQWPWIVYPDLDLAGCAAPDSSLRATLVTVPFGALVLVPSLWMLFRVFKSRHG